jgi:large conductance mechanosensitive channel
MLRTASTPHTVEPGQPARGGYTVIKELRDFLFRGNVIDLAVAVIIAAAFTAVVSSLVADILTPLLGLLGIPDFSTWTIQVGDAEMRIGLFLNAVISFLLVGAAVFFLIVKPASRLRPKVEEAPAGPTEVDLLTEIRDELRQRPA